MRKYQVEGLGTRLILGFVISGMMLLLLAPVSALSAPATGARPSTHEVERRVGGPRPFAGPVGRTRLKVDNQAAARLVKKHYRQRRILGIKLVDASPGARYRIKTLSETGVVAFVYVDAETGSVSE